MTLTIQITAETEHKLKQAAQAAGLSPDIYVAQLIQNNLAPQENQGKPEHRLSRAETILIQTINHSLNEIDWQSYQALIEKREDETLTLEEHEMLIAFSDQVEIANVNRLKAVVDLAKLRNTSIRTMMDELELKPQPHT